MLQMSIERMIVLFVLDWLIEFYLIRIWIAIDSHFVHFVVKAMVMNTC